MATAKKAASSQDEAPEQESEEFDYEAEREAQRRNVTGGKDGGIVGGPTQADLNPAYAPPPDDNAAPE